MSAGPSMLLLPEAVTMREAPHTLRMLAQAMQGGGAGASVTIDASGLRRFDSSALAVLIECARRAKAWGKRFDVHGAPPKLVELARLYGIGELLSLDGPR